LLIDFNKDTSRELETALISMPFKIIHKPFVFSTSTIALNSPGIIVARYHLSGGFADTLCRTIKADPTLCQIPVLLLSDSTYVAHIARESKANGYFIDPLDIDLLQKTILQLILPKK
jgi:response regulator RpfG family c-di-GMP phosphodiesterase